MSTPESELGPRRMEQRGAPRRGATRGSPPCGESIADRLAEFAGDRSFVMSFARGMSVFQAFHGASRPLSIADISHRMRIPRAAIRRLLHTLLELGFVRVIDSRYVLAPKTLEIGRAFVSSNNFSRQTQPMLMQLAERLDAFVAAVVPERDDAMLVCMAGTTHVRVPRALTPSPGSKVPLYAAASGLLFLSELSPPQLDAYFARAQLLPLAPRTPSSAVRVRELLNVVRLQRYALADRTMSEDLRSVAVPIRDANGAISASLITMIPADRLTCRHLHECVLPMLNETAHGVRAHWRLRT